MRALVLVLVGLVIANVIVAQLGRSASRERTMLAEDLQEVSLAAEQERLERARAQDLLQLLNQAREYESEPRGIGALRDALIHAERGLSLDRLSLEFRPEQQLPAGFGGALVQASLRGPFESVYEYLRRVEARRLALSPETVTLRQDASFVTLSVRWSARWPLERDDRRDALTRDEIQRLSAWLGRDPAPRSGRNPFSFHENMEVASGPPEMFDDTDAVAADEEEEPSEVEPAPTRPVLTGFVLARPEVEPDVRRRVLAALRYDDTVRLVMVGDVIGAYVVEKMEARESVTLTRADTGERIRLTLQ